MSRATASRSSARPRPGDHRRDRPLPFASVLCGVGAGIASLEAARQAAVAAAGGRLTLVAIEGQKGTGPEWAELAAAFVLAARDSEPPEVLEIAADRVLPPLLLLAGRHDLLVIGAHEARSRREDITREIVHQSPVPVLVARRNAAGAEVTDRILVALDERTDPAATVATALAERHGAAVDTLTLPDRAARSTCDLAAQAVLDAAERSGATLVVISSRGLAGVAALESVSAAVAARAGCSVLVLRPTGPPPRA